MKNIVITRHLIKEERHERVIREMGHTHTHPRKSADLAVSKSSAERCEEDLLVATSSY